MAESLRFGALLCYGPIRNERYVIARTSLNPTKNQALKRLKLLRAVYGQPQTLRSRLGLKRRKMSRGQKILKLLSG